MDAEWWRGAVLYQVFPRSFLDTDGDGLGDLPGVTARLHHVARLGVDAVQLGPFFSSPGLDFGYDVANQRAVDPRMGSLADFDALVERAHALGLKVVVDQVWSHTSDAHAWFAESRAARRGARADWYVWADPASDGGPPNDWLAAAGGPAWTWEPARDQYYLRRFMECEPALNLHNPAVVDALMQTARFWADRGVDGLRFVDVDLLLHDPSLRAHAPLAAPLSDRAFARQAHVTQMLQSGALRLLERIRSLGETYSGLCTLGEASSVAGPIGRTVRFVDTMAGLDMAGAKLPLRGLERRSLQRMLAESAAAGERGWPCWSFGGRDEARALSRMAEAAPAALRPACAKMLLALLLSLRGSATLCQGAELGLSLAEPAPEDWRDPAGRDAVRPPMPWLAHAPGAGFTEGRPWLPIPPAHLALAVDVQEADPASPLNAARAFLAWRRREPALRRGELRPLSLPEPLIGFLRVDGAAHVLAVFNLSPRHVALELTDFASVSPATASGFAAELRGGEALLAPFGAFFARVEPASLWEEEAALSYA